MPRKVKTTKVVTIESAAGTTRLFHGTIEIYGISIVTDGVDPEKVIESGGENGVFWATPTLWKAEVYARSTAIAFGGTPVVVSWSMPNVDLELLKDTQQMKVVFDGLCDLYKFHPSAQPHLNKASVHMEMTIIE